MHPPTCTLRKWAHLPSPPHPQPECRPQSRPPSSSQTCSHLWPALMALRAQLQPVASSVIMSLPGARGCSGPLSQLAPRPPHLAFPPWLAVSHLCSVQQLALPASLCLQLGPMPLTHCCLGPWHPVLERASGCLCHVLSSYANHSTIIVNLAFGQPQPRWLASPMA